MVGSFERGGTSVGDGKVRAISDHDVISAHVGSMQGEVAEIRRDMV